MPNKTILRRAALASTVLFGLPLAHGFAAEVTQQRLENADKEPQNWLLPFQNYQGYSFSRLAEINRDNVKNLHVAFTLPLHTALIGAANGANLMNHPIIEDGFAYLDDGWGAIYKLDLRKGDGAQVLWKADGAVSKDESNRTRGVAIYGNAIYHNLTDGRVIAVNKETGDFIWDKKIARVNYGNESEVNKEKENFTASPLPINGKILVGQSNGDSLTRGWLEAVDAATGASIWRTYMVPSPGEPGHETWKDKNEVWRVGGAALWTTGTYDPETKITYWGTGNAQPMYDAEYRPGDNLYSASVVGMNVDDGKIKMFFQYAPNEGWDYDETAAHLIIPITVNGQTRKVLDHWGRNGFHYQLDAGSGAFIGGTQYVDTVNWTKGLDPKTGKPVEYDPKLDIQTYIPATRPTRDKPAVTACPTTHGGIRWQPPAYNPDTHLTYQSSLDGCFDKQAIASFPLPNGNGMIDPQKGGGIRGAGPTKYVKPTGLVAAVDVATNKVVARIHYPVEDQSSVLATAGGLVFTGYLDGRVVALDDKTLEEKWHFNTGIAIKGAFVAYAVNGKEYIAIIAGGGSGGGLAGQHPELLNQTTGAALYVFSL